MRDEGNLVLHPFKNMLQTNRFWKFSFISAGVVLMLATLILFYIWSELTADQHHVLSEIARDHIYEGLGLCFLLSGSFWVLSDIVYTVYIKPVKKISAEAQVIYESNPSHRIAIKGNKDIADLIRVINDFADLFESLDKRITQQILAARTRIQKERNLLAAVMSEIPHGIIICNTSGQILLFNSLAKQLFTHSDDPQNTHGFIGLGRSIYHLLDKGVIRQALDEINTHPAGERRHTESHFITAIGTGRLIRGQAMPVLDKEKTMTGVILSFQEVSDSIKTVEAIETCLSDFGRELSCRSQKAGMALKKLETLSLSQGLEDDINTVTKALEGLGEDYARTSARLTELSLSVLALNSIDLNRFLGMVQKEAGILYDIRINIFNPLKDARILADPYSLSRACLFMIRAICSAAGKPIEFSLSVSRQDQLIGFDISWEKEPVAASAVMAATEQKIDGLPRFGHVLKLNRARLHPIGHTAINRITITVQASDQPGILAKQKIRVLAGARPEFYNFNLFQVNHHTENLLDTPLKSIVFTAFDTETTGLCPEGGDEIISIGAVRIVNNRINYQDTFEELVDPRREIPMEAYKIHGISHEMVTGRDTIDKVLPRFKRFSSETVFLGHNIAFDLKMLKLKENLTGIKFTNPALDTLLLSSVLHPVHDRHDLASIANRLGVKVIGRHSALGDALITAEIFLKLIPILNSNGILTLNHALKASKKTYYARLKY